MFGIAGFAQTPFASLAGASFSFSLTEDLTADDSSTQLSAYLQTITEPITESEIEVTGVGLFFASINENFNPDDASTQLSTFLQSITEDANLNDTPDIAAQFAADCTEDTVLVDDFAQTYFEFQQSREEDIIEVADASTQQSNFLQSLTEPLTSDDIRVIAAQFAQSVTENVTMDDIRAIAAQFAQSVS